MRITKTEEHYTLTERWPMADHSVLEEVVKVILYPISMRHKIIVNTSFLTVKKESDQFRKAAEQFAEDRLEEIRIENLVKDGKVATETEGRLSEDMFPGRNIRPIPNTHDSFAEVPLPRFSTHNPGRLSSVGGFHPFRFIPDPNAPFRVADAAFNPVDTTCKPIISVSQGGGGVYQIKSERVFSFDSRNTPIRDPFLVPKGHERYGDERIFGPDSIL